MHIKTFFSLIKTSVTAFVDDYAPSMGAAIAFYTVFSLAPLLIILLAIAGFFWGEEAVQGQLMGQLSGMLGQTGASAVEGVISSAEQPAEGTVATVISLGVLAVGATTVFAELQSSLDRIWKVPPAQKKTGIWNLLRARLLSFGLVLGLAFLLLVSLVVSTMLSAFGTWASGILPASELLLQVVNTVVSVAVTTILFAMIFKYMPQAKVAWREVFVGALVTAVLFEVGKVVIGMYLGMGTIASSYAAAGSFVAVLIWVYYAALVFLFGAEFTWAYATTHGTHSQPADPEDAAASESVFCGTPDYAGGAASAAPSGAAAPPAAPAVQAARAPGTAPLP